MSIAYKVFDCQLIHFPAAFTLSHEDIPEENKAVLSFSVARSMQLTAGYADIDSICAITALAGSFEIKIDDGNNKKTLHVSKSSLGILIPSRTKKEIVNFSPGAICLVLLPEEVPLVSIAAINYNNSKTVVETLESIRNQTYPNIELIVIDDCSTENDVEVISDWLKSYTGKYKFIRHPQNRGISATYNSGLKNATGKYFSTIDTDDAIVPKKIEIQVDILENSDAQVGAVYSDAYLMDIQSQPMDGLFIQRHRQFGVNPSGRIYEALLQGNYIPVMSALMKRSIFKDVGEYDEGLYDNDYDMWLRISRDYAMIFSDFISSRYRIRPGSLSFVITPRQWNYTDSKIFLKHIGAPLPMPRIRKIGHDVYYSNDNATMPAVKELAIKTGDLYLKTACVLWKYRITPFAGCQVLEKVQHSGKEKTATDSNNLDGSAENIFLNDVVPVLPNEILSLIAIDAYKANNIDAMELATKIAAQTNNRHIRLTWLMWKLNLLVEKGLQYLTLCNEQTSDLHILLHHVIPDLDTIPLRKMIFDSGASVTGSTHGSPLKQCGNRYLLAAYWLYTFGISFDAGNIQLHTKDNIASYTDAAVFLVEKYTAIPGELLKNIVANAYNDNDGGLMTVCNDVAAKTNLRFVLTAYLLWKYEIKFATGSRILGFVDDQKKAGLPIRAENGPGATYKMLAHDLLPSLPADLKNEVAADVYANSNAAVMPMIRELAKNTGSRYLKAAWLLWRYKVFVPNGKIILKRINGYIGAQVSNKYIDLCIYKDIFSEIRASNSSFFKAKKERG